jgi:short subunit dehydrogenase-like uncharacterized protein
VSSFVNPTPDRGMYTFHTHVLSAVGAEMISRMHTTTPYELILYLFFHILVRLGHTSGYTRINGSTTTPITNLALTEIADTTPGHGMYFL